ncbi:hypothetical protein [Gordoniibacillus kamchatkensis]|uniref:hypothetical protein n=1 Tax=Gordoniibacillus kamchatkensis TaxID=1590651 RepID=UPI000B00088A|nr:hypothetical protein [Paenibacillus sp. VKM B-2647]
MTTSRNHQEAHGIGQIEEQLSEQADAVQQLQGGESELDEEVAAAADASDSELDDIIVL